MKRQCDRRKFIFANISKFKGLVSNKSTLSGYLVRGVLGNGTVHATSMVLRLLSSVVLARTLGAEGFGVFSFSLAVVALLGIPVQFGLPQYLVKTCAVYRQRVAYRLMKGLIGRARVFVLSVGTVVSLCAGMIVSLMSIRQFAMPETLLWALVLIPWAGLCVVNSSILRGVGAVTVGQLPDQVIRPTIVLGTVLSFIGIGWSVDPVRAMQINVVAAIVASGVTFIMLARVQPDDYRKTKPRFDSREWMSGVIPFAALSGTLVLIQQVDIIMLGVLAGPEEVGIYNVVARVGALVVVGLAVINPVIAPQLARLYESQDWKNMQLVLTYTARVALIVSVPIAALFLVYSDWLLSTVYGVSYLAGQTALTVIVVGQLVNVSMGTVGQVLNVSGRAWYTVAGVSAGVIVNVLLNFILIPKYGVEGAAISSFFATCTWNGLLAIWVYKYTGLVTIAFYRYESRV